MQSQDTPAPSVDGLIARLESAHIGSRELGDDVLFACGWQLNWSAEEIEEVRRGGWKLDGEDIVESFANFADQACWYSPGHKPFRDEWIDGHYRPNPTVSVDAALTLMRPEWRLYALQEAYIVPEGSWFAGIDHRTDNYRFGSKVGHGRTPALALCAAILKATAASPPTEPASDRTNSNTEES